MAAAFFNANAAGQQTAKLAVAGGDGAQAAHAALVGGSSAPPPASSAAAPAWLAAGKPADCGCISCTFGLEGCTGCDWCDAPVLEFTPRSPALASQPAASPTAVPRLPATLTDTAHVEGREVATS